jgi:hypothetical protein
MISKTTAADTAVTQTIQRAVSREGKGRAFASALAEQRQQLDVASAQSAGAEQMSRVPIGRRAADRAEAAASSGRTPVGSTAAPPDTRQPLTSERSTASSPGDGTRPNLSTADVAVNATGSLSEQDRTNGMYIPPDFYHGTSYSPVFDQQDADGNWVRTPRFEGQKIYSDWRGSLPEDFDPNARVVRDPLAFQNNPNFWNKNDDGTWTLRETGYGGIPLYDNGKPVFTPDPLLFPEYWKV